MHTDIKDLEVTRALRRLGNVRVTEWEFRDIIPKVKEIAATEVDVLDLFKRTANYRVNDWEIGGYGHTAESTRTRPPSATESQNCIHSLSSFLRFVVDQLIDHPEQSIIKVSTPSPSEIKFRLILSIRDESALIGHGGHTASAIRRLMQDAGTRRRFFVDLAIMSHEEEDMRQRKSSGRTRWRQV